MDVPVIDTPRLRLRAHRADDHPDCLAMWSDPAVVRYIGGKPSTEQQTWGRILTYAGLWTHLHFGYWAIEERASGRFAGEAGFADFKRDIAPSMRGVPEIGWAFAPLFHGRGFASEAVAAIVAWADRALASPRTVCIIHPDNAASVRVAEKNGYRVFERSDPNASPALFLERQPSA